MHHLKALSLFIILKIFTKGIIMKELAMKYMDKKERLAELALESKQLRVEIKEAEEVLASSAEKVFVSDRGVLVKSWVVKKGSLSYVQIVKEQLPSLDLDLYRKPDEEVCKFTYTAI